MTWCQTPSENQVFQTPHPHPHHPLFIPNPAGGISGVRMLRAALCNLELRRRHLDGTRRIVGQKSPSFHGRPRAVLSVDSSGDEGGEAAAAAVAAAAAGAASTELAAAAAAQFMFFDSSRGLRDDWGMFVRRALLRLAGAQSDVGPLRGDCAREASRSLHVTRAARAAAAFTEWLANGPSPLVSVASAMEAFEAVSWAVFVLPLYESFTLACAAREAMRGSAAAVPTISDVGDGDADSEDAPTNSGPLFVTGLELTVLTEGAPRPRPQLPKPLRGGRANPRGGGGVYLLCRVDACASPLEVAAADVAPTGAEPDPRNLKQQLLRLGRAVAVILPSRAAARAPQSLAGARLVIAGKSSLLPPDAGRDYSYGVGPAASPSEEGLLEVFPPLGPACGAPRFFPPNADSFAPLRMRDEARVARAAQQARVDAAGADVVMKGAVDAAKQECKSALPVAATASQEDSVADAADATGSFFGDSAQVGAAAASAGAKRPRESGAEEGGRGVAREEGPVEGGAATDAPKAPVWRLPETGSHRLAFAQLDCDTRAVALLRAALEPGSAANVAAAAAGKIQLSSRFSAAETARALAIAQKQLKTLLAPAATCARCLCEPTPASAPAVRLPAPASLADAVKAWASVRQRGRSQGPITLGPYTQGTFECDSHWRLRIRTEGLLRHVSTASVEKRFGHSFNAAEHAAAALLLDDYGGLSPEFYVKGSAEAAAAAARAEAATSSTAASPAAVSSASAPSPAASGGGAAAAASEEPGASPPSARVPAAKTKRAAKTTLTASESRVAALNHFFAHVASRVHEGVLQGGSVAAPRAGGGCPPLPAPAAAIIPSWSTWTAPQQRADADAFLAAVAGLLEAGLHSVEEANKVLKPAEAALLVRAVVTIGCSVAEGA